MRGDPDLVTAIAFGYYETLIHLGDANKFLEEETRLRSLSNVLNAAGYDEELYEDFADQVFSLLRNVAEGMQDGSAESILFDTFNNEEIQNYIITHFRVSMTLSS
jgi:ubiquitin thioesterase protein OTUB1